MKSLKRKPRPLGTPQVMAAIAQVRAMPLPKGFVPVRKKPKPRE